MKELAPIVIFVYNRLEHTQQTIEALARNILAKESNVFIYSDAAKTENGNAKVQATRQYIDSIVNRLLFKSVTIIKAEKNRGLANSVIHGVTETINNYGKVIVVEDDLVTTPDFLTYMNKALDFYEKDQTIWSISGYSFKMKIPKSYAHEIFYSYRASSWGYATWADRWNTVDWDVKDYPDFKSSIVKRKQMNRGGRDMARMLDSQMEGRIDSWAIRWCYAQSKQNKFTIYPVHSRVKNIGLDGSGTHSKESKRNSKWDSLLSSSDKEILFEKLKIDKRIARRFRNRYGTVVGVPYRVLRRLIKIVLMQFQFCRS